eukprot:Blabericola_migrator_1__8130@NODE_4195_length_1284_cov_4_329499_g2598_i0_p1_GENE_NODE_4195_length_1284_cov_4_329499_g2598_i0NODE_4195_length_1284_cov_4_329499_g2598_i0_p1_ORF_typecomplete_len291_score33_76Integrin_beta/PF00362_18/2_8e17VWA/PF00092_28/9_4e03VWA/PF00092_28/0_035_NODE_4195_length_1284_cov_4_329499_g2598_i01911063
MGLLRSDVPKTTSQGDTRQQVSLLGMASLTLFFVGLLSLVNAQPLCRLQWDIMFLQDTTDERSHPRWTPLVSADDAFIRSVIFSETFWDDLSHVVRQLPDLVDQIIAKYNNVRFGVAEFRDKPYSPLGETDDFCYRLGEGSLGVGTDRLEEAYEKLFAIGGGDIPDAHLQALIDVSLDPNVGWRFLDEPSEEGEIYVRLIIMFTDAPPHLPGAMLQVDTDLYPDVPRNLPPNSGEIVGGDPSYACKNQDYPSHVQVKDVLRAQDIHLAILTHNKPDSTNAWSWFIETHFG